MVWAPKVARLRSHPRSARRNTGHVSVTGMVHALGVRPHRQSTGPPEMGRRGCATLTLLSVVRKRLPDQKSYRRVPECRRIKGKRTERNHLFSSVGATVQWFLNRCNTLSRTRTYNPRFRRSALETHNSRDDYELRNETEPSRVFWECTSGRSSHLTASLGTQSTRLSCTSSDLGQRCRHMFVTPYSDASRLKRSSGISRILMPPPSTFAINVLADHRAPVSPNGRTGLAGNRQQTDSRRLPVSD